jgi:EAL domain-containing protein (putative c-di-GMP-specific phosphodiesterase class I)
MREGVLRKGDQLGRISRDQFACLLPNIAGEGVAILAANKILDALEMPVPIGNRSFDADAVIGIAVYPDHGADQQGLVRNAKLAAAAARELPERTAVYAEEQGAEEERSILLEMRLRHALEQGSLELAYTPQLDLRSGRIAALSCGLHWHDAELGVLSEDTAMQAAERAGLARELTWWLYNNALRQYAEFVQAGLVLPFALKLTASGVTQPDFADFLDRALRTWKTPLKRLTIEIHESALLVATEELKITLARLKKLGVRLCIDDLGTASCSLASLAQLPLDEVKIAAVFVGNNEQQIFHVKTVRLLVKLAESLDLTVTAEGVKDANSAQALTALGCTRIQGVYVGRPLSVAEVRACRFDGGTAAVLPFEPAG